MYKQWCYVSFVVSHQCKNMLLSFDRLYIYICMLTCIYMGIYIYTFICICIYINYVCMFSNWHLVQNVYSWFWYIKTLPIKHWSILSHKTNRSIMYKVWELLHGMFPCNAKQLAAKLLFASCCQSHLFSKEQDIGSCWCSNIHNVLSIKM